MKMRKQRRLTRRRVRQRRASRQRWKWFRRKLRRWIRGLRRIVIGVLTLPKRLRRFVGPRIIVEERLIRSYPAKQRICEL